MPHDPHLPVATAFTIFPRLPEELRCLIWARAALLRPRVIQLRYDPTTNKWHTWKDGCGGLPSIITVSKEARKVALKGYTWVFDTLVDLEDDTIFISDPVFSLRRQQRAFFNVEHTNRIRKLAMSREVYDGLEQTAIEFPTLCLPPPATLRRLQGLTHFILVLSEDGEGDLYGDSTDASETWPDAAEEDGESGLYGDSTGVSETSPDAADGDGSARDSGAKEVDVGASPSQRGLVPSEDPEEIEARQLSRRLSCMEKEALEAMTGYVLQPGNIHFASALRSVDHWDDARDREWVMTDHFNAEKRKHPEWVRPKFSIMVVKYGLKQLCDYCEPVHDPGDFSNVNLEDPNSYAYDDEDSIATAGDQYSCAADGYGDEEENSEANLDELQGY